MQRKLQEAEEEEDAMDRINIGEDVQLDVFDVQPIEDASLRKMNFDAPELDDIEILA
jgi:hypothetical protein